jgi:hypothetical protein
MHCGTGGCAGGNLGLRYRSGCGGGNRCASWSLTLNG